LGAQELYVVGAVLICFEIGVPELNHTDTWVQNKVRRCCNAW